MFCFSSQPFSHPAAPLPLVRAGRHFDSLEKGDPDSSIGTAASSCVTAHESLSLSESPFSVKGGWRGQSDLQGPIYLLSL